MASKTEGIYFNDDGTITLVIDGTVRHLRRPRLGEIREYEERLLELSDSMLADIVHGRELGASITDDMADDERAKISDEVKLILRRVREYTVPWTAAVVEAFSDKPLPEDPEDWPSWLARDTTNPTKIVKHWTTTPLPPGSKGTV